MNKQPLNNRAMTTPTIKDIQAEINMKKECKHTWDTVCDNCGFTVQYATRIEQIKKDAREQALSYLPEQLPDRVVPMLEHYITQTAEAVCRASEAERKEMMKSLGVTDE